MNLSETDLNCINRALKEFLKSRDKSIYDFSHYMELQDKIENHILFNKESLKNLIDQVEEDEAPIIDFDKHPHLI